MPPLLFLPCCSADLIEAPQRPQIPHKPSTSSRKQKRGQEEQEAEHPSPRIRDQPSSKRLRAEPSSCAEEELHPGAATDTSENSPDPLHIGFGPGGGVRSTSNKTARSEKTSRGASHRKSSDIRIGCRSITPESHSDQCTVFTLLNTCLRGRSPQLPFTGRIRNQPFRHPAINYRGKLKALNTGIRTIHLNLKMKAATCASPTWM